MTPPPDPANFAAILSSRLDKSPMPRDGEDDEMGGDDKAEQMKDSAASAMISAMHTKDVKAFKESLCDFLELYDQDEDTDPGSDDDDDDMGPPDAAA